MAASLPTSSPTMIGDLVAMTAAQLRKEWQSRLGLSPPDLKSRDLLAHALAYRLQVKVHGDLPLRLRREADLLATRFEEDRSFRPTPGPNLKPGSSLIKEWGGVRHEVAVLADGFAYDGRSFRSLSAVAQHITGVKWNGLVFFGLRERR